MFLADFTRHDRREAVARCARSAASRASSFKVIKNTLLKRASTSAGSTALDAVLEGPTGLAVQPDSEVEPARVLVEFAKENEKPQVKAAVVGGRLYDAEGDRRSWRAAEPRGAAGAGPGHAHRADDAVPGAPSTRCSRRRRNWRTRSSARIPRLPEPRA